jgi:hypothetical protein
LVKGNPDILWSRFDDHPQPTQSFRGFALGPAFYSFKLLAELGLYQVPTTCIDVFQCLAWPAEPKLSRIDGIFFPCATATKLQVESVLEID